MSHRPFAALAKEVATKRQRKAPTPDEPAQPRRTVPDERAVFAAHMADVKPLARGKKSPSPRVPMRAAFAEEPARAADPGRPGVEVGFETADDGERMEGRRLDVDPKELRRLRRGLHVLDGTLDLHGKAATEARSALLAFVKKHRAAGDRVVLVIHGRGRRSAGGQAVLRGEIAAWLSQSSLARHVFAFVTAPDEQGGAGALLVLLAR